MNIITSDKFKSKPTDDCFRSAINMDNVNSFTKYQNAIIFHFEGEGIAWKYETAKQRDEAFGEILAYLEGLK